MPFSVQPWSKCEQEAHQLLDKLVCSSDPAGEPDIYSISYLRKRETNISYHGSDVEPAEASVDQMQGDRGHPGPALYPDDFMGGWGHARFPTDFTSVACLSADDSARLVDPQLERKGQIHDRYLSSCLQCQSRPCTTWKVLLTVHVSRNVC